MKKILLIIFMMLLLTSCEQGTEINKPFINSNNKVSFIKTGEEEGYYTFTFDKNDFLENVYIIYEFESNEKAIESQEIFVDDSSESLFDSVQVEGNNLIIKCKTITFSDYAGVSKDEIIEDLENNGYVRK